jgi:hypothetical protein
MPDALPGWPRYLPEADAARYLGVPVSTFRFEVAAGMWPAPVARGARAGRRGVVLTWDRLLLDGAADALSRLAASSPAAPGAQDHMVAAALAAADRD